MKTSESCRIPDFDSDALRKQGELFVAHTIGHIENSAAASYADLRREFDRIIAQGRTEAERQDIASFTEEIGKIARESFEKLEQFSKQSIGDPFKPKMSEVAVPKPVDKQPSFWKEFSDGFVSTMTLGFVRGEVLAKNFPSEKGSSWKQFSDGFLVGITFGLYRPEEPNHEPISIYPNQPKEQITQTIGSSLRQRVSRGLSGIARRVDNLAAKVWSEPVPNQRFATA